VSWQIIAKVLTRDMPEIGQHWPVMNQEIIVQLIIIKAPPSSTTTSQTDQAFIIIFYHMDKTIIQAI
jgi:hypothetical protein